MKKRNVELDEHAIKTFTLRKVLTIAELARLLVCSIITVRRRLKEWRAYTSSEVLANSQPKMAYL